MPGESSSSFRLHRPFCREGIQGVSKQVEYIGQVIVSERYLEMTGMRIGITEGTTAERALSAASMSWVPMW